MDFDKPGCAPDEEYQIKSINFKGCGDGHKGGSLKPEDFDKILM